MPERVQKRSPEGASTTVPAEGGSVSTERWVEIWLESVPETQRSPTAHCLVSALGYRLPEAWTLLELLPTPCLLSPADAVDDFLGTLETLGVTATVRSAPGTGRCQVHPVAAFTFCERCGIPMCRVCTRRATATHCRACTQASTKRGCRRLWALIGVLGGLVMAGPWLSGILVSNMRVSPVADSHDISPQRGLVGAVDPKPSSVTHAHNGGMQPPDAGSIAVTLVDMGGVPDASRRRPSIPTPPSPAIQRTPAISTPALTLADVGKMIERRRFNAAHAALRAIIATRPNRHVSEQWALAVFTAARIAHRAKYSDDCDRFLELGLAHHYGDQRDELLLLRARRHATAGRLNAAIGDLREISPLASSASPAKLLLAETFHRRGDLDEAIKRWGELARGHGPQADAARRALKEQVKPQAGVEGYGVHTSQHFTLRLPPDTQAGSPSNVARNILEVLEHGYDVVTAELGRPEGGPIPSIAYDLDDFTRRFGRRRGSVLLGVYLPSQRTLAVNGVIAANTDARGRETLIHELTHAIIDRLVAGGRVAVWLNEGVARYLGRKGAGKTKITDIEWLSLKQLAQRKQLAPLRALRHTRGGGMAYLLGSAVTEYIHKHHGLFRVTDYLRFIREGQPHARAFDRAFGVDEATFERRFLQYLSNHSTGSFSTQ